MNRNIKFPEKLEYKGIEIKLDSKTEKSAGYWVDCYRHKDLYDMDNIIDFIECLINYIHSQGFNFRLDTDIDDIVTDAIGEKLYGFYIKILPSKKYKRSMVNA